MTPVEIAAKKVNLLKYNILVLIYFTLALMGPYVLFRSYIPYIPSEWQWTLIITMFVIYGFEAVFLVAVIPLGMVFISSWLYLVDIKAKVRSLYPVVVTSLIPFLILLSLIVIFGLFFVKATLEPTQDIPKLAELIKADIDRQLTPRKPLFSALAMVASLASVLICARQLHKDLNLKSVLASPLQTWPGWMQRLHERHNLSAVIATLIPLTFAGSLFLFQKLSTLVSGDFLEKLQNLPRP
jgi:hypothetical protein